MSLALLVALPHADLYLSLADLVHSEMPVGCCFFPTVFFSQPVSPRPVFMTTLYNYLISAVMYSDKVFEHFLVMLKIVWLHQDECFHGLCQFSSQFMTSGSAFSRLPSRPIDCFLPDSLQVVFYLAGQRVTCHFDVKQSVVCQVVSIVLDPVTVEQLFSDV